MQSFRRDPSGRLPAGAAASIPLASRLIGARMYGLLTTLALLVLVIVLLVLAAEGYNRFLSRRRD